MAMSLDLLELKLGYTFSDPNLLTLALTHRSHGDTNNERLEFLGDAALGLVVSHWLFSTFPRAREHDLTLMRADLVKGDSLTGIARQIELGDHLRLGIGERRSGGFQRASILANALEAIIGAVLQDGGIDAVTALVRRLFHDRFETAAIGVVEKDSKTKLQELLQARRVDLPEYRVLRQEGDAHEPLFTVECVIPALAIRVEAQASNRRDAEKQAAQQALELIQDADDER
jgi:ribonuclease III